MWVRTDALARTQKALVDQADGRAECFIHGGGDIRTAGKDRRGRVDWEQAGQRPEAAEGALFVRVEQLITPGDGRIHRLLAGGKIARAGGREQDVVLEPAEQTLGGQHFDPRRCELERERQCIEPLANRGHGHAVRGREAEVGLHIPNAFHEEAHCGSTYEVGRRHCV